MCKVTVETLTLLELVRDPLIQMVMRSDGVSEEAYSALLYRIMILSRGLQNNPGGAGDGRQLAHPVPARAPEATDTASGDDARFTAGQAIPYDIVGEWLLKLSKCPDARALAMEAAAPAGNRHDSPRRTA